MTPLEQENASPIRSAVFDTIEAADRAVAELLRVGFPAREVSVVCSSDYQEQFFGELIRESPSKAKVSRAVGGAGIAVVALGGAAAIATLVATGGASVFVIGAFTGLAATGATAAAFLTRGAEGEEADFVEQSLDKGKILVSVHLDKPDAERLQSAEAVFTSLGARPLALGGVAPA